MDRLRIKSKIKGLAFLLCQDWIEENKKATKRHKKIIKKSKKMIKNVDKGIKKVYNIITKKGKRVKLWQIKMVGI